MKLEVHRGRKLILKKEREREYFTETIDRKLRIMKFYLIWNFFLLFFLFRNLYKGKLKFPVNNLINVMFSARKN